MGKWKIIITASFFLWLGMCISMPTAPTIDTNGFKATPWQNEAWIGLVACLPAQPSTIYIAEGEVTVSPYFTARMLPETMTETGFSAQFFSEIDRVDYEVRVSFKRYLCGIVGIISVAAVGEEDEAFDQATRRFIALPERDDDRG